MRVRVPLCVRMSINGGYLLRLGEGPTYVWSYQFISVRAFNGYIGALYITKVHGEFASCRTLILYCPTSECVKETIEVLRAHKHLRDLLDYEPVLPETILGPAPVEVIGEASDPWIYLKLVDLAFRHRG